MSEANVPSTISARAVSMISGSRMMIGGKVYAVMEQVTKSVLVQRDGFPLAVTFKSLVKESNITEGTDKDGKVKMNKARVADVIDMTTGSLHTLIMNTVLEKELTERYPGENGAGFLGMSFAINSARPVDAEGRQKRYRVYDIIWLGDEIVDGAPVETETVTTQEESAAKHAVNSKRK